MNILKEYAYKPFYGLGSPSATRKHNLIRSDLEYGLITISKSKIFAGRRVSITSGGPFDDNNLIDTKQPDILVCLKRKKIADDIPVLLIEITTDSMQPAVLKTTKDIFIGSKGVLQEAFVFNYESYEWFKISTSNTNYISDSYSKIFDVELDTLIKKIKYRE